MSRDIQIRGMVSAETMTYIISDILNILQVPSEAQKACMKVMQERLMADNVTNASLVSLEPHSQDGENEAPGFALITEAHNRIQELEKPYLKPHEISVMYLTQSISDDKRLSCLMSKFILDRRDEVQESLDRHEISPKVWKCAARLVRLLHVSHTVASEPQQDSLRNIIDAFATAHLKQYAQDFKMKFLNRS